MYVKWGTTMKMLPLFSNNVDFQRFPSFLLEGAGGLTKNDHKFPFLRIVELFERSLIINRLSPAYGLSCCSSGMWRTLFPVSDSHHTPTI